MSQYVLTSAQSAKTNYWHTNTFTLEEINDKFNKHVSSLSKDGPCFVPGRLIGAARSKTAISEVSMVVYDLDQNSKYEDIVKAITDANLYAYVYSTYSHLSTRTDIKTDAFLKWAKKRAITLSPSINDDLSTVLLYLQENDKAHLEDVSIEGKKHTPDGLVIVITHAPVNKYRVVFPLNKPYVLAETAYSTSEALDIWKRIYSGIGNTLNFNFDKSCSDVSRLYYLPTHKPDTPYKLVRIEGDLLDVNQFDPADEVVKNKFTNGLPALVKSKNGVMIDLTRWYLQSSRGCGDEILDLIREKVPDLVHDANPSDKGLYHLSCPFEDEHSTPGGRGTFFKPENENGLFHMHCMHGHCVHRSQEDFIGGMLDASWFTLEELIGVTSKKAYDEVGLKDESLAAILSKPDISIDQFKKDGAIVNQETGLAASEQVVEVEVPPSQDYIIKANAIISGVSSFIDDGKPVSDELATALYKVKSATVLAGLIIDDNELSSDPVKAVLACCASGVDHKVLLSNYPVLKPYIQIPKNDLNDLVSRYRQLHNDMDIRLTAALDSGVVNFELASIFKEISNYTNIPVPDIKRIYSKKTEQSAGEAENDLLRRAYAINEEYAKIIIGDDLKLLHVKEPINEDGSLNTIAPVSARGMHSNNKATLYKDGNKVKKVNVFDYWYNEIRDHTIYKGVVFDPSMSAPPHIFNEYKGLKVTPKVADCSIVTDHIKTVWCNGDDKLFGWVMMFFANMIQDPANRYPVAIIISGENGTGKSVILEELLAPIVAPYSKTVSKSDSVVGKFTANIGRSLFYVVEEAAMNTTEKTDQLKSLVSAVSNSLEAKNVNAKEYKLYTRFVFTTNHADFLKLDRDDRRFCILNTVTLFPNRKVEGNEHIFDAHQAYFDKLRAWIKDDGPSKMLHYLQTFKPEDHGLNWGMLKEAPRNNKTASVQRSFSAVEKFMFTLAHTGQYMYMYGGSEQEIYWEMNKPLQLDWDKLDSIFRNNMRAPEFHMFSEADKTFMRFFSLENPPSRRKTVHGKVSLFFLLPPRKDALAALVANGCLEVSDYKRIICEDNNA